MMLNFDKPFIPLSRFETKTEKKFTIQMTNAFLNRSGKVYKYQELNSIYKRTIQENYNEMYAIFSHCWSKVSFTVQLPKKPETTVDWTFAEGREFASSVRIKADAPNPNEIIPQEKFYPKSHCFQSIEETYSDLPKLPATSLLILQTLDIITFDTYLSYIHCFADINSGWNCGEWVHIDIADNENDKGVAKIGFNFYSEDSTFKNGTFYLKLTGYGRDNGKNCAVYDYYCDNARVSIKEKERRGVERTGGSYYHGQIWVNLATGDLERGTMLESYIALQQGMESEKIPIHIRRRIDCHAVQ